MRSRFLRITEASYNTPHDGYKHLAVSVIQRAIVDADSGDKDAVDWLLDKGVFLSGLLGADTEVVREVLCKKYAT